ncbi:hypothetical protein [Actinomadura sp. NBRC 104412]|uniref:hypothetical protein n=1 Tax=Actinomadura sp. NBRC 104412 TaxID=3032203 RepID=UPI0025561D01|nr:hypothetical protein [Actinomadura sp. NBRC 104412]
MRTQRTPMALISRAQRPPPVTVVLRVPLVLAGAVVARVVARLAQVRPLPGERLWRTQRTPMALISRAQRPPLVTVAWRARVVARQTRAHPLSRERRLQVRCMAMGPPSRARCLRLVIGVSRVRLVLGDVAMARPVLAHRALSGGPL